MMKDQQRFPSPEEVSFLLLDRKKEQVIPLDRLPEKEWERLRSDILLSIGRGLSQFYLHKGSAGD